MPEATGTTATQVAPLDLDTARRLMATVVGENPDFIYSTWEFRGSGCYYVPLPVLREEQKRLGGAISGMDLVRDMAMENDPRETTGCLIGMILDRHGQTRHRFTGKTVMGLSLRFPWMFANERVVAYLSAAQQKQDGGGTWQEAMDEAEAGLPALQQ